ncbi:hypothetical protein ACFL6P_00180 [Candidatus Latescibacterota bacterium]
MIINGKIYSWHTFLLFPLSFLLLLLFNASGYAFAYSTFSKGNSVAYFSSVKDDEGIKNIDFDDISLYALEQSETKEITLTSPNGGESWVACTTQNITWTSSNVDNVKIEYSTDNGYNWTETNTGIEAAADFFSRPMSVLHTAKLKIKNSETLNLIANNVNFSDKKCFFPFLFDSIQKNSLFQTLTFLHFNNREDII